MIDAEEQIWSDPNWVAKTQYILDSWDRLFPKPLIPRSTPERESEVLFTAPIVVVAHGIEADPILNFANRAAIELWETSLDVMLKMPSRETAEPVHRDERAELLRRTTEDGFIQDYSGIRISVTGKRFQIKQATVWNLADDAGNRLGQAAVFSSWVPL